MSERKFFLAFTIALLVGSVMSFAIHAIVMPDYVSPIHGLMVAHAAAMYVWYSTMALQAWLITVKRVPLHRTLGYASIATAVAVLITGWMITVYGFRLSNSMLFLSGNLLMLILFAGFFLGAVIFRKHAPIHKRLIVFAGIAVYIPVAFRTAALLGDRAYAPLVYIAIILVLPIWEVLSKRKLSAVTLLGAGSLLSMVALTFILANNATWASWSREFFGVS